MSFADAPELRDADHDARSDHAPSSTADRADARVRIRELQPHDPLPLGADLPSPEVTVAGMSRAMRRTIGEPREVVAVVAERGRRRSRRPLAVAWCTAGGRSTVDVRFARGRAVDDEVMTRLFVRVRRSAACSGAMWLRWRLASDELSLLDSIRTAVGVPVLHREGDHVVAAVALDERWRSR